MLLTITYLFLYSRAHSEGPGKFCHKLYVTCDKRYVYLLCITLARISVTAVANVSRKCDKRNKHDGKQHGTGIVGKLPIKPHHLSSITIGHNMT